MSKRVVQRLILILFVVALTGVFNCAKKAAPPPPPGPTPEELAKQKEEARKKELADKLRELGVNVDPSQYTVDQLEKMLRDKQEELARKKREEEQLRALRDQEIRLMNEIRGSDFVEVPSEMAQYFQMVHFDFDKYNIKDEFKDELQATADYLKEKPDILVLIEGHCDERGTNEYNMGLGERRALSVRNYLISLGIASERLSTISYGEERPLDPGHNEIAWAKNRRVQYKVRVP